MILNEVVRQMERQKKSKRIKVAFALDGDDAETFLEAYQSTVKDNALSQGQFAGRILIVALERELGGRPRRKRSQGESASS
mgnify:CR=1 FL=1